MDGSMLILEPLAPAAGGPPQFRRALAGLAGKVVGFIDNSKPNFHYLAEDLAQLLVSKYGVSSIVRRRKATASVPLQDAVMRELTEQCDAIVTGSGD